MKLYDLLSTYRMKDTIQLSRSKKYEELYQTFLKDWKKKHPDLRILDEQAVDHLRKEGVLVERISDLAGNLYYLMESPFPYAGTSKHFILYMGDSDYPPNLKEIGNNEKDPRYPTFITLVQNGLVTAATMRSVQNGYDDYLVVVRKEKGWSKSVPYVQLLLYSNIVQKES